MIVTLESGFRKLEGRTARIIGIGVIGWRGGVDVYEPSATSGSVLARKPAMVMVHLVECSSRR